MVRFAPQQLQRKFPDGHVHQKDNEINNLRLNTH